MSKIIRNWEELTDVESDSYYLDIDFNKKSGWIRPKFKVDFREFYCYNHYLDSNIFTTEMCDWATNILQSCGFDVTIDHYYDYKEVIAGLWEELAEMLGVEMGEYFKIKHRRFNYVIQKSGLYIIDKGIKHRLLTEKELYELLNGELEICKWPEVGDYIYYPDPARDSFINSVEHFEGSMITKRLKKSVGIYKTVEGARERARELGWID